MLDSYSALTACVHHVVFVFVLDSYSALSVCSSCCVCFCVGQLQCPDSRREAEGDLTVAPQVDPLHPASVPAVDLLSRGISSLIWGRGKSVRVEVV